MKRGVFLRYIGGKVLLTDEIISTIKDIAPDAKTIIDAFSGSGVVSFELKKARYDVFCNDQLYFSFVLLKGSVCLNSDLDFKDLGIINPILYLNNLKFEDTNINIDDCFIYQNYSPQGGRMYFTEENALKIDIIRLTIRDWFVNRLINYDEYYYLLAALINAVPFVSNIAGMYSAYLKHWDNRAFKKLTLIEPKIIKSNQNVFAYNEKIENLISEVEADILYSDSPYNKREYLPNYHILETIARYDYPKIHGVTGMRDYKNQKSEFCSKKTVSRAFENMIRYSNVKYIVISYNSEGLLSTDDLSNLCKKYAVENTFSLKEIPYRRYKSNNFTKDKDVFEQIYSFEKKKNIYFKSPFNYTGGKYKLLKQIDKLFPRDIDRFFDLFCGGGDVCFNVLANEIYANDKNKELIGIFKYFQSKNKDDILNEIENIISEYELTMENKDGYYKLREDYNKNKSSIKLFVLICFSFNHHIRFNKNGDFNVPFGKGKSAYNSVLKDNLLKMLNKISDIKFLDKDFRDFKDFKKSDFVYIDPPYCISTAVYNENNRCLNGWSEKDDLDLFHFLDMLDKKGVRFAMSNVFEHKGIKNENLINWSKKYNVHHINFGYKNCSYNLKNKNGFTDEVLICNY